MKTVKPDERLIANIHTADYKPWIGDQGEETGQSVLQLGDENPPGVGFHVFKMEPGITTTPHEHTEHEEFLLLSGDLRDNDGTDYQIGDLVWMKKGTQHSSYSEHGCLLAVYIKTAEESLPVSA